jgi:hypothetical protein
LDLSKRTKAQLRQLLDGDQPIGGFFGVMDSSAAIFERKNDAAIWSSVVDWAKAMHILSVRQLTFPSEELARSHLDIRIAIGKALGLPSILRSNSSYVLGWNVNTSENANKLAKLVDDEKKSGSIDKVAEQ